ncbi:hypothetical protein [Paenibacillus sp. BGI2013]|nr:hypothetical protein [Paenibacillus sp. BGI2013]
MILYIQQTVDKITSYIEAVGHRSGLEASNTYNNALDVYVYHA